MCPGVQYTFFYSRGPQRNTTLDEIAEEKEYHHPALNLVQKNDILKPLIGQMIISHRTDATEERQRSSRAE